MREFDTILPLGRMERSTSLCLVVLNFSPVVNTGLRSPWLELREGLEVGRGVTERQIVYHIC